MQLPFRRTKKRSLRSTLLSPAGIAAVAAGTAVVYFFDPRHGTRRRNMALGKTTALFQRIGNVTSAPRTDAELADKVRSEALGHFHGAAINVNVENGIAVLRGVLPSQSEIADLEQRVRKVSGVLDVRNLVHLPGETPPVG